MNLELAIVLALGVAAINGGTSVLDRIVMSKGSAVQSIGTVVFFSVAVSGLLGALVVPIFAPVSFDLTVTQLLAVVGAGLFQVLPLPFYYMAIRRSNATRVLPLTSASHAVVVIGAFLFLGERLSLVGYVGVALIIFGTLILTSQQATGSYQLSYGALLALLATVLFGGKSLTMKFALNTMGTGTMIFYTHVFAFVFGLLAFGWKQPREEILGIVAGEQQQVLTTFVAQEMISGVSSILRPLAYSFTLVSIASPVAGILPAFTIIYIVILSQFGYSVEDYTQKELIVNALALTVIIVGLLSLLIF